MRLVAQATWTLQMAGLEQTEAQNTKKRKVDSAGSRYLQTSSLFKHVAEVLVHRFGEIS